MHLQRIGHFDLKPENIFLTLEGYIKVADFGDACRFPGRRILDCTTNDELNRLLVDVSSGRQTTTKSSGTPGYAAPEVVHGLPYSYAADVYSLGVIWWAMLMGSVSNLRLAFLFVIWC